MNSNLCTVSGVAYTTSNIVFWRSVCLFVICLLSARTMGAPVTRDEIWRGVNPEVNTNVEQKNFFLRTIGGKLLEILKDGTVQGSNCARSPTKYSLLQGKSHCHTKRYIRMTLLYGLEAQKYLCIYSNGTVYAAGHDDFSEDDCGFNISFYKAPNVLYPLTKYKHAIYGHAPPSGKGIRKLHLVLTCNNAAITIYKKRDRKFFLNDTLFLEDRTDLKTENLSEKCTVTQKPRCSLQQRCPEFKGMKKTHVKFCTKVSKHFFGATLKELRLFRKRNCWNVLRKARKCRERNQKHHTRRHRHHHGSSRGKRSDPFHFRETVQIDNNCKPFGKP